MNPIILPTRIDLIKLEKPGSIGVEVGVWRAYFSVELLKLPLKKLYLVDAWVPQADYNDPLNNEDHESNLRETMHNLRGHMKGGRVEVIRGWSHEVAETNTTIPPLSWAYLDAAHGYEAVSRDLRAWEKRLKPDGVLLGHDFTNNEMATKWGFGVIPAVNDFCKERGWEITHLTDEDFASFRLHRI